MHWPVKEGWFAKLHMRKTCHASDRTFFDRLKDPKSADGSDSRRLLSVGTL
jgi:hypothetical protein